jgi:signal transduction histidine kinase
MLKQRLLYSALLSIVGLILVVGSIFYFPTETQFFTFFLLILLACTAQSTMTYVVGGMTSVSVSTAISLAAVPLYGLTGAVLVAAAAELSLWVISLRVDKPGWKHAAERLGVNVGMHTISMFGAAWSFQALSSASSGSLVFGQIAAWVLAALAADQLNFWLSAVIIYLAHGVQPVDTWRTNMWAVPTNVLVTAVGGGLLALSIQQFGFIGIGALFLPIILSAYAYHYTVRRAKAQMAELEELVTLRTQALADANDELVNLQKDKDGFLAVLTHDMRTPLTSIQGYALLLSNQPMAEDQKKHMAEVILRNGEALLDIVNNMLEIEQMKSVGSFVLERSNFDLVPVVDRALEAMEMQAMEKSIELQCELPDAPLLVYADEKKIERVLLNLVSNAIKYTPSDGHVWLKARANGRYAIVDVIDNGYGIPDDELEHIFDSYRRVKQHEHIAVGTGLGLSIVKSLIEAHEGFISVQSQLDVGSTFTVKIPSAAAPE